MSLRSLDPLAWAETALQSRDVADAWAAARGALQLLGVENCTFVFGHPRASRDAPQRTSKFGWLIDEDWEMRLRTEPALIRTDPLSKRFLSSEHALSFWRGSALFETFSEEEKRFFRYFEEHGLKAGAIWPSHDRKSGASHVLLSWSAQERSEYRDVITRSSGAVHLAMTYFCEALRVKELGARGDGALLTAREKECLLWIQTGKSSKEIAGRLMLAEATVNEHIANAMRKLGAGSRSQAVARAVMLELITP